jgi:hypothetical protein
MTEETHPFEYMGKLDRDKIQTDLGLFKCPNCGIFMEESSITYVTEWGLLERLLHCGGCNTSGGVLKWKFDYDQLEEMEQHELASIICEKAQELWPAGAAEQEA